MPKRPSKTSKTSSSPLGSVPEQRLTQQLRHRLQQRLKRLGLVTMSLVLTGCATCPPEVQLSWGGASLQPGEGCQTPRPLLPADLSDVGTARFMAFGGGGAPHYNEIALEKNMLYFQRSLQALGQPPAPIFFANGDNGDATLRYLDRWGFQRFKAPEIPNLKGPATVSVLADVLAEVRQTQSTQPLFFYFSGHGWLNPDDSDNNAMILWQEGLADVQDFTAELDAVAADKPVVVMMAQCFSGSFANLIYEGGDPEQPVALRSRCGFFATTQDLPSVGCTPEVNEADYRDYSSSFFAGLTGIDRTGEPVASADYDGDGRVSYREAHAFAKVDEETSDRPISTLEAWLQRQIPEVWVDITLRQSPMQQWIEAARPEQVAVIRALGDRLNFNSRQSFVENVERLGLAEVIAQAEGIGDSELELQAAYLERLRMELVNISAEQQLRKQQDEPQLRVLQQLLDCEGQSPTDS